PFFLRPSYCLSFLTFALLDGISPDLRSTPFSPTPQMDAVMPGCSAAPLGRPSSGGGVGESPARAHRVALGSAPSSTRAAPGQRTLACLVPDRSTGVSSLGGGYPDRQG